MRIWWESRDPHQEAQASGASVRSTLFCTYDGVGWCVEGGIRLVWSESPDGIWSYSYVKWCGGLGWYGHTWLDQYHQMEHDSFDESCHTYTQVMSHIGTSHVKMTCSSCDMTHFHFYVVIFEFRYPFSFSFLRVTWLWVTWHVWTESCHNCCMS